VEDIILGVNFDVILEILSIKKIEKVDAINTIDAVDQLRFADN